MLWSNVIDCLANSGSMKVKRAVTWNKTLILSSSVVTSLIVWRHCSEELIEHLLSLVRSPSSQGPFMQNSSHQKTEFSSICKSLSLVSAAKYRCVKLVSLFYWYFTSFSYFTCNWCPSPIWCPRETQKLYSRFWQSCLRLNLNLGPQVKSQFFNPIILV